MGRIKKSNELRTQPSVELKLDPDKLRVSVTIGFANAITAPTHKATRTIKYSVSFPVWRV